MMTKKVNAVTQSVYNQIVFNVEYERIECPKCHHCGTTVHGYYYRNLKTPFGIIRLRIMRVKCRNCGSTHALLLSSFVPYSWISLDETIAIILAENSEKRKKIMEDNPSIDESDVYRVLRNYKNYWKEKLISFFIVIDQSITTVCIKTFRRQFMQIPCTVCGSYSCHHIIQQDMPLFFS